MKLLRHPAALLLWTALFSFLAAMFTLTAMYYLRHMDGPVAILTATVNVIGAVLATVGAAIQGKQYMIRMSRRVPKR